MTCWSEQTMSDGWSEVMVRTNRVWWYDVLVNELCDGHELLGPLVVRVARAQLHRHCTKTSHSLQIRKTKPKWFILILEIRPMNRSSRLQCYRLANELFITNSDIKDTLRPAILSLVERMSSFRINYCYGKGVQKCVLCWEVIPFSEGLLSEVPLYVVHWWKQQRKAKVSPQMLATIQRGSTVLTSAPTHFHFRWA